MKIKELWGKRKYYSAWGVFLILVAMTMLKAITPSIFKDLTIFIWLGYFGANTVSKFANKGSKK